jgi:hypothetical protein
MLTDAEILSQFRDFMARQQQGPATFVPLQNHPLHRGVLDQNFVRPTPTEFPKVVYHISGSTKIVQTAEEQKALGPAYSETPAQRPADWRSKLNEVYTKSGFRVHTHHLAFLKQNDVPDVETLAQVAEFLDKLDEKQQEEFFREAEEQNLPAPAAKEEKKSKSRAA